MRLKWSDHKPPNSEVQYDHCVAETPFGSFVLTWKGWKDNWNQGIGFDETPWGDVWYDGWRSVEQAKEAAQIEMDRRLKEAANG